MSDAESQTCYTRLYSLIQANAMHDADTTYNPDNVIS